MQGRTSETISGSPNAATACNDGTYTITTYAVDNNYNVDSSFATGTFSVQTSDPHDTATYTSATFSGGSASITLNPSQAGAGNTVTMSANTTGLTTDAGISNYTINAGTATKAIVLLDGQSIDQGNRSFTKTGSINAANVGSAYNITVQATDACHNHATSTASVDLTLADTNATDPTAQALVAGTRVFSVTHHMSDSSLGSQHNVTLSSSLTDVNSDNYTVNYGARAEYLTLLPGETLSSPGSSTRAASVSGSPSTQVVGTGFNITVKAVDAYFNVVENDTTSPVITTSDSSDVDPGATALTSGTVTLAITPVDVQASATITSGGDTSPTFVVNDIAPATMTYSGTPFTWTQNTTVVSETPTAGSGGTATSFAVQSGSLPSGISLNASTGELSGTPTATQGATALTIRATNTGGFQDITLNITVLEQAPNISYAGSPFTWTKNSSIGTITETNSGGTISGCSVTSGSLPSGISLDANCDLTGTPTVSYNTANVDIQASNGGGTSTTTVSITVNGIELSKSGDSEAYGTVSTASDTQNSFVVTNDGNITANFKVTAFTPDNGAYWTLSADTCDSASVNSGNTCGFDVTFNGNTGAPPTGSYSATIVVELTDSSESVTFNLTATVP